MRIHEFCMFHNEHPALAIKQCENAKWVDQLYVCQADRTFRNGERDILPLPNDSHTVPLIYPASERFQPAYSWGPSRRFPFFRKRKRARQNEAMQRNYAHEVLSDISAEDLVILSDIDEIIDSRFADEIISAARRHGIISLRLHHTVFYLNLYSENWDQVWPGSPPDYAYRVFVMTGEHFHAMRRTSDDLRRQGEWAKLSDKVTLLDGMRGFHHSWLGGVEAALDKIKSYSHSFDEHRADLVGPDGKLDEDHFCELIRSGQSIFPDHHVKLKNFSQVEPLVSVRQMEDQLKELIL